MFENLLQKYITAKNIIFFILAVLFIIFISKISEIAIMFFASFVIACSLEPIVQKLEKKFKRSTSCAMVLIGSILIILAFFVPIIIIGGHEIGTFAISFPQYMENIKSFFESSNITQHTHLAKINFDGVITSLSGISSKLIEETLNIGKNLGSAVIYLIASTLIIYYFMVDKNKVKEATLRLFPRQMRKRTGEIFDTIALKSGGYIIAQIITMASVGIIVTIGLLILRNEYALLLGLITAIFDIIPVVGPAIAFLICMVVVYKSGPLVLVITAIIFALAQIIENNFVRPHVFSKFLDLHPLIIYLFLFIAAKYMGIIGVVFAPAIAATVVVLIEEVYIKAIEK